MGSHYLVLFGLYFISLGILHVDAKEKSGGDLELIGNNTRGDGFCDYHKKYKKDWL